MGVKYELTGNIYSSIYWMITYNNDVFSVGPIMSHKSITLLNLNEYFRKN